MKFVTPSNPIPGILLCMIGSSQASCWAIEEDDNLEPSCSQVHCLRQSSFLPLFLTSLFLSLPPLCLLIPSEPSFLPLPLQYNSVLT